MASSFDIDTAFIERLAELLQRNGLTEIEVCQGETRVRVAKQPPPAVEYLAAPSAPPSLLPASGAAAAAPAAPAAPEAPHPGAINSPMVGTVYLAPDPASPAYASVGDTVKEGQTLLIIEAMKVMNTITAPRAGTVSQVLVQDAQPVEFDQPLVILE